MVSKKKNNSVLGVMAVLLVIFDLASLAVLFSRLSSYSQHRFPNIIPMTRSEGATTVTTRTYSNNSSPEATGLSAVSYDTEAVAVPLANPGFKAYDDKTVWLSETSAEIFRLAYDGENGISVQGTDGDKTIAPGTSNIYSFTLENTGDVLLDYDMTMEAKITGTDLELPVKARVWDYTNRYLLGSTDSMNKVLELNSVEEHSKLSAGRFAVYNLEWEWPYEWDNDEYDTLLGNMAVNGDLSLMIKINTIAMTDETEDDGSNAPKSDNPDQASVPDNSGSNDGYGLTGSIESPKTGAALGMLPAAVLTAAFAVMMLTRPKSKENDDDGKE